MKDKIKLTGIFFLLAIFLIGIIQAADFTPQGDINLRGIYAIKNATNITAQYWCNSTNCYSMNQVLNDTNTIYYAGGIYLYLNSSNAFFLNETRLNSTIDSKISGISTYTADGVYIYLSGLQITLNETKLNNTVNILIPDNLSQFVDDLGNRGYTSLSNFTNNLGFYNQSSINSSELTHQGDGKLGILDSFINLLMDNRITQAFIKALGFYDNTEIYNKTEINSFNDSWSSTYNSTYAGLINNESYLSTFNQTYHNYVVANQSNSTTWWAGISGFLTTYFFKNGNNLDLNETKLNQTILLSAAVYNETGIINSVNTTLNIQALGFYTKSQVDNNLTLYLLLTDQRFNETALINSINTSANIQSLGFYTKAQVDNNLSLYLLLTDQRYNETLRINSVNSTVNIQALGFYNKTEIDNNFSLYLLLTDQRFNETAYVNTMVGTDNLHKHDTNNLTNIAGLNNKITIQGENITGGTIAFARLPSLTNTHTLACQNITGATSNLCTIVDTDTDTQKKADGIYLYNDTTTIFFNETKMNGTIDTRAAAFNETTYINNIVTNNNASWTSTYNLTYHNFVTANQSNSTTWWAGLRGFLNNWLFNNGTGYLSFNETKLNNTIATEGTRIGFNSTFNSTYAGTTSAWNGNSTALLGCINNASYLSTFNLTYAGTTSAWNGNSTALLGCINNQSYLSTYNATYAGYTTTLNETSLALSVNATANTKAFPGDCPAGQVVMNTTTTGVQCIVPPAGSESDPVFSANFTNMQTDCAAGNYTYGVLNNGTLKCRSDVSGNGGDGTGGWTNDSIETNTSLNVNINDGANVTANYGFLKLAWTYLQSIPSIIYGLWADNNANSLLISNGTAIGYNETIFNNSILTVGLAGGFNSTYNATYAGCVNNASYLSTYNATYAGTTSAWDGNSSALLGCVNNASYLSTYNVTYHNFVVANMSNSTTWWNGVKAFFNGWIFNNGTGYMAFNETKLNSTISIEGIRLGFNSTFNSTYATTTTEWNGNKTALIGCVNNASYLSTYNSTYATWAYNQTIPAQTYANANFYNKSADIVTNSYNITTNKLNVTTIFITQISGACDLTKAHSICANATGTYVVG